MLSVMSRDDQERMVSNHITMSRAFSLVKVGRKASLDSQSALKGRQFITSVCLSTPANLRVRDPISQSVKVPRIEPSI